MQLQSHKGTYALIFQANQEFVCRVGRRGNFEGFPGSYVYVGSAFGPGGVQARIIHHLKLSPKPHWHLDYIRPYMQPIAVCYSYSSVRQEHRWATVVSNIAESQNPMHKFGSSDCACSSHLFYFQQTQILVALRKSLKGDMHGSLQLHCMNLTKDKIEKLCG